MECVCGAVRCIICSLGRRAIQLAAQLFDEFGDGESNEWFGGAKIESVVQKGESQTQPTTVPTSAMPSSADPTTVPTIIPTDEPTDAPTSLPSVTLPEADVGTKAAIASINEEIRVEKQQEEEEEEGFMDPTYRVVLVVVSLAFIASTLVASFVLCKSPRQQHEQARQQAELQSPCSLATESPESASNVSILLGLATPSPDPTIRAVSYLSDAETHHAHTVSGGPDISPGSSPSPHHPQERDLKDNYIVSV